MIGRRGPLQAAFTIKELREMLKLEKCQTIWKEEDFEGVSEHLPNLGRPRKRITELMLQSLNQKPKEACFKTFHPKFYRSPIEIKGQEKTSCVVLGINTLTGEDLLNKKAILTLSREDLACDLVVPSIGYKPIQIDKDIPFDHAKGIVKNNRFKVEDGLYVAGWLGTGPTGVILTTMSNAFEVAEKIAYDINIEGLTNKEKEGSNEITDILKTKNVNIVDWEGWKKIDKYEQKEGVIKGKPREKIVDIKQMLNIAAL